MTARDAGVDARARIASKLVFTAYMVGAQTMPNEIAEGMASMLAAYPTDLVLGALDRCCRELKTSRLTISDVTSRFKDGRPGPQEAWTIAGAAFGNGGEAGTIVWTREIAVAWGKCRGEDEIPARMAFLEIYSGLVAEAREAAQPPEWEVSLGHSSAEREAVLAEAVRLGRIEASHAARLLGHVEPEQLRNLLPTANLPELPAPDPVGRERVRGILADLKQKLAMPRDDENRST